MLRNYQRERIMGFLGTKTHIPWKILVLDSRTQEIISPLIRVNELRECNITTHFLLNSRRNKIKEVAAIYFVESSERTIELIIKDVLGDIYSTYYINFSNTIRRPLLEKLATALAERGKGFFIKSVFDHYLDFIALQNNLFTLNYSQTFLNPLDANTIAQSLFGIFLTLKEAPFIISKVQCPVAEKLLRLVKGTKMLKNTHKKPLLVLVDRKFDLKTPIEHVWTYSALIKDLLGLELNKVSLKSDNKTFDLDPTDEFWLRNIDEYFPVVAERIENELVDYKKEMALRCVDEKSDKKKIEEALEKAPELAKKKATMHAHMSICLALVELIKKRSIDEFYRIEKGSFKKQDFLEISEKGESEDILRMAISMLRNDNMPVMEALLKNRKVDTKLLSFFKNIKSEDQEQGTSYRQVVSSIMGSVKKLLPVNNDSPLSKYIESIIMDIRNQNFEKLNILNPFGSHCFEKEISRVVVFCNGGGTYTELKSLNELGRRLKFDIIYGSTEIVHSGGFIEQIKKMI